MQKPNTVVTAFSKNKNILIGKYKQTITTQNIKDVNASPRQKAIFLKILCSTEFYALESDGLANVMEFVSNEVVIYTSLAFQEV